MDAPIALHRVIVNACQTIATAARIRQIIYRAAQAAKHTVDIREFYDHFQQDCLTRKIHGIGLSNVHATLGAWTIERDL